MGPVAPSAARRLSECLLLAVIAAFAVWLADDAVRRSPTLENLVMIVPAAILVVALAVGLAVAALRARDGGADRVPASFMLKACVLLLLLVGLVAGFETIGFDTASFLFLLAAPVLLGERRVLPLLAFATLGSAGVVAALRVMLPYDMPTLLL